MGASPRVASAPATVASSHSFIFTLHRNYIITRLPEWEIAGIIMKEKSDPNAWLSRAKSNLELAKCRKINDNILYEDLCHQCELAAEKALKAVLFLRCDDSDHEQVLNKIEKKIKHNFDLLIKEMDEREITIPNEVKEAATSIYPYSGWTFPWRIPWSIGSTSSLQENAIKTRYPGNYPPFDERGYKNALEKAEIIVGWVEQQFKQTFSHDEGSK